ncbi:MAG TPA: gliding motility protein GldN [Bacteroidia bacterium]|nr:gliding motility protein GldN [Bacteroidia bacterium]
MRTFAKICGTSVLVFLGFEFSVAQVGNTNANPPAQQQPQVSQAPAPQNPNSQSQPSVLSPNQPLDGAYKQEHNPYRRVVPPAQMREADAMWQTRIWRVIDVREKINEQLYYPEQSNGNRVSLFQILKDALLGGEISCYEFNPVDLDDCYKIRYTKTEVEKGLSSIDTVQDENGNMVPVKNDVVSSSIKGYMLKEDWIFEKQRSVLDPRILFICPRVQNINKNTGKEDENAAPQSLFWIYFNDTRPIMAKTPVFNQQNDAERRTFDDIFWKRQFASYIIQQSNVYDRAMSAYVKGLDALLEGEKIHDNIAGIEHDMWQY